MTSSPCSETSEGLQEVAVMNGRAVSLLNRDRSQTCSFRSSVCFVHWSGNRLPFGEKENVHIHRQIGTQEDRQPDKQTAKETGTGRARERWRDQKHTETERDGFPVRIWVLGKELGYVLIIHVLPSVRVFNASCQQPHRE